MRMTCVARSASALLPKANNAHRNVRRTYPNHGWKGWGNQGCGRDRANEVVANTAKQITMRREMEILAAKAHHFRKHFQHVDKTC
jgi:hypothetical protein